METMFAIDTSDRKETPASDSAFNSDPARHDGKMILNELFRDFEQAREEDNDNQSRRFERNPWLEHTMWESHISPYKEWRVRMTRPDGIIGNHEGGEEQPVGDANEEANAATTASEEALEQPCVATRSLNRRSYHPEHMDRFVRILRYIWRVEDVEIRPKYRLTSIREEVLAKSQSVAARVAEGDHASPVSVSEQHAERQAKRRERLINTCCTCS